MKEKIAKKRFGFLCVVAAALFEVIGLVRFAIWAPNHDAMDITIIIAIIAGLIFSVVLTFRDIDIVMVLITVCYSYGVIRLLTNSVGSFVDAYQKIVMFGDATQVGNIITMAVILGIGLLLTIVAGFLKREIEEQETDKSGVEAA